MDLSKLDNWSLYEKLLNYQSIFDADEIKKVEPNSAWVLFAKKNFWGRTIAACGSSEDPDRHHNFGPFDLNFKLIEYNNLEILESEFK